MRPLPGTRPLIHPVFRFPLLRRLAALDLDPDHYAVHGSGPMLAHGLKTTIGDLDVIARGPAWERALALGEPGYSALRGDPCVRFWQGRIEVFRTWVTDYCTVDDLIDGADVIEGIRFVQLPHVLAYKRLLGRQKDTADILALEKYLSQPHQAPAPHGTGAAPEPVAALSHALGAAAGNLPTERERADAPASDPVAPRATTSGRPGPREAVRAFPVEGDGGAGERPASPPVR